MGYYTTFSLETKLPKEEVDTEVDTKIDTFVKECKEKGIAIPNDVKITFDKRLSLKNELEQYLDSSESAPDYNGISNATGSDSVKWYDYDKDMKRASKKFPEVLFTLSGEGEESGDLWKRYYLNGKVQVAMGEVKYPDFDMSELK